MTCFKEFEGGESERRLGLTTGLMGMICPYAADAALLLFGVPLL